MAILDPSRFNIKPGSEKNTSISIDPTRIHLSKMTENDIKYNKSVMNEKINSQRSDILLSAPKIVNGRLTVDNDALAQSKGFINAMDEVNYKANNPDLYEASGGVKVIKPGTNVDMSGAPLKSVGTYDHNYATNLSSAAVNKAYENSNSDKVKEVVNIVNTIKSGKWFDANTMKKYSETVSSYANGVIMLNELGLLNFNTEEDRKSTIDSLKTLKDDVNKIKNYYAEYKDVDSYNKSVWNNKYGVMTWDELVERQKQLQVSLPSQDSSTMKELAFINNILSNRDKQMWDAMANLKGKNINEINEIASGYFYAGEDYKKYNGYIETFKNTHKDSEIKDFESDEEIDAYVKEAREFFVEYRKENGSFDGAREAYQLKKGYLNYDGKPDKLEEKSTFLLNMAEKLARLEVSYGNEEFVEDFYEKEEEYRWNLMSSQEFRKYYAEMQDDPNASSYIAKGKEKYDIKDENISEEEYNVACYHLGKGATKKHDYFVWLKDWVYKREVAAKDGWSALSDGETLKYHTLWSDYTNDAPLEANIMSVALNLGSGIEFAHNALNGEIKESKLSKASSKIREAYANSHDGEFLGIDYDFLYNTVMSGIDSLTAGKLFGKGKVAVEAASILLGLSAAASGVNDALDRGMTGAQALFNGLANGINEYLWEKVSLGQLDKLSASNGAEFKTWFKNLLKESFVNATEETATEASNMLYDTVFNGDLSHYSLSVQRYIDNGLTEEEAKNQALKDLGNQIAEAAGSGALMGFGFSFVGNTSASINAARYGKYYYGFSQKSVYALVDNGLAMPEGSEAYKLAIKSDAKLKKGKNLSGTALYNLATAIESEIETKSKTRFSELGIDKKAAKELSPIVAKAVFGEKLNSAERATLNNSEIATQVVKELSADRANTVWKDAIKNSRNNNVDENNAVTEQGEVLQLATDGVVDSDNKFNYNYSKKEGEKYAEDYQGTMGAFGREIREDDAGGKSENAEITKEDKISFKRRIKRTYKNSGRLFVHLNVTVGCKEPKTINSNSPAGMAYAILKSKGYNVIYCDGPIQINNNEYTVERTQAVTIFDGTIYISGDSTLNGDGIALHEVVHVWQYSNMEEYLNYKDVLCEELILTSEKYKEIAREINDNHYNGRYDIEDINSFEHIIRELAAYISQYVCTNPKFAREKFAEMFENWENVVQAVYNMNDKLGFGDVIKEAITETQVAFLNSNETQTNGIDADEFIKGISGEDSGDSESFVQNSTNAVTNPLSSYAPEKRGMIIDFLNSVDEKLKAFVERVKNGSNKFERFTISDVSDREAADIKYLLGIDVDGYTHNINTNGIRHILKRHGISGSHDHTMSNNNDIARMGWVIKNYDSVEVLFKKGEVATSDEFRDTINRRAPQIRYSKKINGTYYVVEAVFENNYNKLWVQSAYLKNNKEGVTQDPAESQKDQPHDHARSALASPPSYEVVTQVPNAAKRLPMVTSETPAASPTSNNNVSQSGNFVNDKYLGEKSSFANDNMQAIIQAVYGDSLKFGNNEVSQSNADSVVDGDIAATQHNENSKLQSNKKNNIINSVGDNFVNKEADNESVREIREKYFRKIGDDFQGGISETAETFSERTRRNSLEGSGKERLLLNEGKLIIAYTPVKDDNSPKNIFFKKLRERGIDIYYCDGVIETNVDGITLVHNQAITTRGGKIFVSNVATVEFKSMMDHELVHWKMRMFSDSYFEYEDIVLRNLNRESNYYIDFCEELNLREYNNRYDINTIEGAIALNSEITAYVYQYVLNDSNFAENFFSKMFFDWHNVKNAVKRFNSKMEINTELFNQVGSYDESAFFAYKNKIENNTTEQGEVLQSTADGVVDNVAGSTVAQQGGQVDAPEGVGAVQSDSNGVASPGVVRGADGKQYFDDDSGDEHFGEHEISYLSESDVISSFDIKRMNDTIHVQEKVFETLLDEGFFEDFNERKTLVKNKSSGMIIEINKSGIRETFNYHNFTQMPHEIMMDKLLLIRNLPLIIRNGKIIEDNVKNIHSPKTSVSYAYIVQTVRINGVEKVATVVIRKSPQKNKFWTLQIDIKNNIGSTPAGISQNSITGLLTSNVNDSLSQKFKFVNIGNNFDGSGDEYFGDTSGDDVTHGGDEYDNVAHLTTAEDGASPQGEASDSSSFDLTEPTPKDIARAPTAEEAIEEAITGKQKTNIQRHIVDICKKLFPNITVEFVDKIDEKGKIKGKFIRSQNKILIRSDLNAVQMYIEVFKHEFMHRLETKALYSKFFNYCFKKSKAFEQYVRAELNAAGFEIDAATRESALQDYTNYKYEQYKNAEGIPQEDRDAFTMEMAREEIIADFFAQILIQGKQYRARIIEALENADGESLIGIGDEISSEAALMELKQKEPTLYEQVKQWIRDIIDKLRGMPQAKSVVTDLEYMESLLTRVYNSKDSKRLMKKKLNEEKYLIAGEKSQTANHSLLFEAQLRAYKGEDSESIRRDTGWYKGRDGKWRYYIPDNELNIDRLIDFANSDEDVALLGDVIVHDKLFAAYPELKSVKVEFKNLKEHSYGEFIPNKNIIYFDYGLLNNREMFVDVLIHETQHAIQVVEGFARGGNEKTGFYYAINIAYDMVSRSKEFNSLATKEEKFDYLCNIALKLFDANSLEELAYKSYLKIYGEVEAREVSKYREYDENLLQMVEPIIDGNIVSFKAEENKFFTMLKLLGYNDNEIKSFLKKVGITSVYKWRNGYMDSRGDISGVQRVWNNIGGINEFGGYKRNNFDTLGDRGWRTVLLNGGPDSRAAISNEGSENKGKLLGTGVRATLSTKEKPISNRGLDEKSVIENTGLYYAINTAYDMVSRSEEFNNLANKEEKFNYLCNIALKLFDANSLEELAYKSYLKIYGEVEARQVTRNRLFDDELLRYATPDVSGNVVDVTDESIKFIENFTEMGYTEKEILKFFRGVTSDESRSVGNIEKRSGIDKEKSKFRKRNIFWTESGTDAVRRMDEGGARNDGRGVRSSISPLGGISGRGSSVDSDIIVEKNMGVRGVNQKTGFYYATNKKMSSSQYLADLNEIRKAYVQDVKENYSNFIIPNSFGNVNIEGNNGASLDQYSLSSPLQEFKNNNEFELSEPDIDNIEISDEVEFLVGLNGVKLSKTQKHIVDICKNLDSNITVEFVDNLETNGKFIRSQNKILIRSDLSAVQMYVEVFKHEFMHRLETKALYSKFFNYCFKKSKAFEQYVRAETKLIGNNNVDDMARESVLNLYTEYKYNQYINDKNIPSEDRDAFTMENAQEEIIADFFAQILFQGKKYRARIIEALENADGEALIGIGDEVSSEAALLELQQKEPTLLEQVIEWFRDIINRLRGLPQTNSLVEQLDNEINQLESMVRKAYQTKDSKRLMKKKYDEIKFSLMNDNTFESNVDNIVTMNDIDALLNKEEGNFVRVMYGTPAIVRDNVSDAENLDVIISFYSLYLAIRKTGILEGHYHNLGSETIKKLPEYISNPDAIIRTNNDRLNLFVQISTAKGNNGILSIELNTVKDINNHNDKYNLVVTVFSANDNYTKNNIIKNTKKIEYQKENLLQVNPQLYEWLATINNKSSLNSIAEKEYIVNDEDSKRLVKKRFGEVKFDLSYNEAIEKLNNDNFDKKNNTHVMLLENTPQIYIDKAGAKDLKIIAGWDIIYLALHKSGSIPGNYHGLGIEVMKKVPEAIKNPLYIIKQNNGRIIAITEIVVKGNRSAIISLELDTFKSTTQDGKNKSENYNLIVTFIDAKPNYLQNTIFAGDIVYNKNNESPTNFTLRLKSLKKASSNDDLVELSFNSISDFNENVNAEKSNETPSGKYSIDTPIQELKYSNEFELNEPDIENIEISDEVEFLVGLNGVKLSKTQKHIVDICKNLDSNITVEFVDNLETNGKFIRSQNKILIRSDLSAVQMYVEVFKHEFMHRLETKALYSKFFNYCFKKSKAFEQYVRAETKLIGNNNVDDMARESVLNLYTEYKYNQYINDKNIPQEDRDAFTMENAREEIIADFFAQILFQGKEYRARIIEALENADGESLIGIGDEVSLEVALLELQQKEPTLLEQVKQWLRGIIDKLRGISQAKSLVEQLDNEINLLESMARRAYQSKDSKRLMKKKFNESKYSFEGYEDDGKGKYKSNFPKGTPKSAKGERILNYIQKVWSKKPIRLKIIEGNNIRYITAKFDPSYDDSGNLQSDASKLMGGNRHGTSAEQRVTLDLADDYYQIASEATYNYSKKEIGKDNPTHKNVKVWHYFVNDIYFAEYDSDEYIPYRVSINIKERTDGEYFYSFSAEKQRESDTLRTLHAAVNVDKNTNANVKLSINNLSQKSHFVNIEEDTSSFKLNEPDIENIEISDEVEFLVGLNGFKLNKVQKHIVDICKKLDSEIAVEFVDKLEGNGKFIRSQNKILIRSDLSAVQMYIEVFKHEFMHRLETKRLYSKFFNFCFKKSKAFEQYVRAELKSAGVDYNVDIAPRDSVLENYTKYKYEQYKNAEGIPKIDRDAFTMENAREEIIADFFAQILFQGKEYRARIIEALENADGEILIGIGDEISSEAALMELQQKEPTLLEQVIQWLKDVINRLRGLPQAKSLVEQLDNEINQLESMARKAYQSKDSKRLMKKKLDEIKFSLMNNNTFESNVDIVSTMNDADALQNKEEGNFVRVMYGTPSIVRENVEDAENLDVIISFYSLYLATRKNGVLEGHYHNLGSEIIKKLPDYINNPDAIVRTNNGRLNLFTQIETPKGNNGILSIELNTVKDINNQYDKYNLVVTVFSAGDNYIRNNIIKNVIKVEYKKENLLQVNPQLYEWLTIVNNKLSLNNINEKELVVNSKDSNDQQTQVERLENNVDQNKEATSEREVAFSMPRDYSYEALINKPDIKITEIDSFNGKKNNDTRKNIVDKAVENAAAIGRKNENGNAVIYVKDIDTEIILSKSGLRHGIDRRFELLAPVLLKSGEILKNSIRINELIPRIDNISKSYILIGVAKNIKNEPYIISFVVNKVTSELSAIDVLYAINAKKESAGLIDPSVPAKKADYFTDSTISISKLLDYVNKYFPDILPESVLRYYGYEARPEGNIGENALFSMPIGKRGRPPKSEGDALKNGISNGSITKNTDVVNNNDSTKTDAFNELEQEKQNSEDIRFVLNKKVTQSMINDNVEKVVTMNSVADLTGEEFEKGPVDLVTQVEKYFNSIGNIVKSKYGDVELTRVGIKSSLGHGIGRKKAAAFKAVPNAIKHGEIINYQKNWKNRGYDTAIFAAPITINGEKHFLAAVISVELDKNSYYLHEVALQEIESNTSFKTGTAKNGTPGDALPSIYSLLHKLQTVNKNNATQTDNIEYVALNEIEQGYIKKICNKFGIGIVFEDLREMVHKGEILSPDGYIGSDGVIHINTYAENPIGFILKHELTHFGEKSSRYIEFVKTVKKSKLYKKWITEKTGESDLRIAEYKYKQAVANAHSDIYGAADPKAEAETIADFVGDMLFTENGSGIVALASDLDTKQRNTVVQFVIDFISFIKKKLSGQKFMTLQLSMLEDSFRRMLFDATKMQIDGVYTYDNGVSFCFAPCNDDGQIAIAEKLEAEGKDSYYIFRQCGLIKDAYGKWKYELNTSGIQLFTSGNAKTESHYINNKIIKPGDVLVGKLSDFIYYKELFKAFPQAKDIKVIVRNLQSGVAKFYIDRYDNDKPVIVLNKKVCDEYISYKPSEIKPALLRELQHVIQYYSGEASGTSIDKWKNLEKEGKTPYSQEQGRNLTAEEAFNYSADNYEAAMVEKREAFKEYYIKKNLVSAKKAEKMVLYAPDFDRNKAVITDEDGNCVIVKDYETSKIQPSIVDENVDAEDVVDVVDVVEEHFTEDDSLKSTNIETIDANMNATHKLIKILMGGSGNNHYDINQLRTITAGDDSALSNFAENAKQFANYYNAEKIKELCDIEPSRRDTAGRVLSDEILERFKNTFLKNKDGKIVPLYMLKMQDVGRFAREKIGIEAGTLESVSQLYSKYNKKSLNDRQVNIQEVIINMTNPLVLDYTPFELSLVGLHDLVERGILYYSEWLNLINFKRVSLINYTNNITKKIRARIKADGYDGIIYFNDSTDAGSMTVVAFDEDQILTVAENGVLLENNGISEPKIDLNELENNNIAVRNSREIRLFASDVKYRNRKLHRIPSEKIRAGNSGFIDSTTNIQEEAYKNLREALNNANKELNGKDTVDREQKKSVMNMLDNTVFQDEKGNLLSLYAFLPRNILSDKTIFGTFNSAIKEFISSKEKAKYALLGTMCEVYINSVNPLVVKADEYDVKIIAEQLLSEGKITQKEYYNLISYKSSYKTRIRNKLITKGYDSVILVKGNGEYAVVPFDESQIIAVSSNGILNDGVGVVQTDEIGYEYNKDYDDGSVFIDGGLKIAVDLNAVKDILSVEDDNTVKMKLLTKVLMCGNNPNIDYTNEYKAGSSGALEKSELNPWRARAVIESIASRDLSDITISDTDTAGRPISEYQKKLLLESKFIDYLGRPYSVFFGNRHGNTRFRHSNIGICVGTLNAAHDTMVAESKQKFKRNKIVFEEYYPIIKNPYFIMFEPNAITAAELAKYMYAEGLLNDKQYNIALSKVGAYTHAYNSNSARYLIKRLRHLGFDSIAFMNERYDPGSIGLIIFDGSQLIPVSHDGLPIENSDRTLADSDNEPAFFMPENNGKNFVEKDRNDLLDDIVNNEYNENVKQLAIDNLTKEILKNKPKYSPNPKKWLKRGGEITVDEHNIWTYTNSNGVSVKYINGYPDFKSAGLVVQEVNIGEFKNRNYDANKANKLAPNGPRRNGNVWHHSEDGETLQEISGKIHKQFTHQGGICKMKGIKKYGI